MYQSPLSVMVGPGLHLKSIRKGQDGLNYICEFNDLQGVAFKTPFAFKPENKTFTFQKYYNMWMGEIRYILTLGKSLQGIGYSYNLSIQVAIFEDKWMPLIGGFEHYANFVDGKLTYPKKEYYIGEPIGKFLTDRVSARLTLDTFDYNTTTSTQKSVPLTQQIISDDVLLLPTADQAYKLWSNNPKHDIEMVNGLPVISRRNLMLDTVQQPVVSNEMQKLKPGEFNSDFIIIDSPTKQPEKYVNYEAPPVDFVL